MKCIIKLQKTGRMKRFLPVLLISILVLQLFTGCSVFSNDEESSADGIISAEERDYTFFTKLYDTMDLYPEPYAASHHLCVTDTDVALSGYEVSGIDGAVGLFDLTDETVLEASNIFAQLSPASTTKVMTAYIVLTRGNLDDVVTVGEDLNSLDPGSSVAGLAVGDQLTVLDLLYALMLPSGNDAAVALADYIGGTQENFVNIMNETAASLMCGGTHFENPHGLDEQAHFMTAYDLYLIFSACLSNETFKTIIDTPSYTASVTHADGTQQMMTWEATNYYFQGKTDPPANVSVLGGKTGTTDAAGSCLILYSKDQSGREFVSVIMKAETKNDLYSNMTALLAAIPPAS